MSISVVTVGKNIIKMGYCFWESLQSCFPFADEIIISEGYSKDDTYKYLEAFSKKYDSFIPIRLYQDEWETNSYVGEAITKATEKVIQRANCEYVYYLQLDEIIPEDLAMRIREVSSKPEFNSMRFPFYHFLNEWQPHKKPAYEEAIRMARTSKFPKLKGDGWTFADIDPVYPANWLCKPIYHFGSVFPKTNDVKVIEHAKIYQNVPEYQDKMKVVIRQSKQPKVAYPRTSFNDFPQLARRFIGEAEYKLPDIT